MAVPLPETFTLTDAEAGALQSIQSGKHAAIARNGPVLRYSSLAAPVIAAAMIWLVDQFVFGGDMSMEAFITLMAVFVAGMMFQTAGYWLNLIAARKRMLHSTGQVFEPRTVTLVADGIEVSIPTATTRQNWSGVTEIDLKKDMVLVWAGNLLPVSVPLRAFKSEQDAEAFLGECKRLADRPAT